ncbi:MAG: DUF4172 domain-containing protein [Thalassospira sp.]|uniref:DUF4172 domain-containing protein n=1 Tax=Thalassospira sp. TaxID=1912094 RepID=UPI0032ECE381
MGKWNWQHRDWPNFIWDREQIRAHLPSVYHKQGYVAGLANSLKDSRALITKALTEIIVASFAIEGEQLAGTDVSAEIVRAFDPLISSEQEMRAGILEANAAALISDVFDGSSQDLTLRRLGAWQRYIFEKTYSSIQIGQPATWRTEDIKVVSGGRGNRKIHFEAHGPLRVPSEMEAFLKWFLPVGKAKK